MRPGLNVLYATGYARDAIVHEGRLDPGIELVAKPFASLSSPRASATCSIAADPSEPYAGLNGSACDFARKTSNFTHVLR